MWLKCSRYNCNLVKVANFSRQVPVGLFNKVIVVQKKINVKLTDDFLRLVFNVPFDKKKTLLLQISEARHSILLQPGPRRGGGVYHPPGAPGPLIHHFHSSSCWHSLTHLTDLTD